MNRRRSPLGTVLLLSAAVFGPLPLSATAFGGELPADAYPGLRGTDGKLIPSVASYLGKEVHTLTLTTSPELLQKRHDFGYSPQDVQKYFAQPVNITIDDTGLNADLIKPVPPPGIHPRVIFNPEDVPLIKARLEKTKAGQSAMSAIREHLLKTITGPKATLAEQYDALVKGDLVDNLDNNVAYCTMYEAFRCLIDKDESGGKRVAAAIATLSRITQKELDEARAKAKTEAEKYDFRLVGQGPTREGTLGLDYDFAYEFMTPAQRDQVRQALANASRGMGGIGCETMHALSAGTSNWVSWSSGRGLFVTSAIEGESGCDPEAYKHFADAQTNFISMIYPTGEAFEGWGKNFMFLEHMVIIAKRNRQMSTIGSTAVRSAYNNYFIASMVPWGDSFTFCDSLARSGCKIARNADVLMYHALFPRDVAGDFIYRNQIAGDYANVGQTNLNTHHPFAVMDGLCCAIFATDVDDTAWDKEHARVTSDRPPTYFSQDTCNMITRSDWNKDALYLDYLNRAVPGGHQYCDRSHFSLYGLGRFWSIYQGSRQVHEQYMPALRSVMLADGHGASTMEARCVDFSDNPQATFEATDLSAAWNYQTSDLEKAPKGVDTALNLYTYNHFRLKPSPMAWMNMPIGHLPDWYSSENPLEDPAKPAHGNWYKRFDVKKAFRTIGIIRGPHPYCLCVDDLQLDDRPHRYEWGMVLDSDVTLGSSSVTPTSAGAAGAEIILDEHVKPEKNAPAPANDRHLLVRVLSAAQLSDGSVQLGTFGVPNPPQKDMQVNKLHVTSDSVSPDFKVLMFPFKTGQALPRTSWSADHRTVTVTWPDQTDAIAFEPDPEGRTRVTVNRNGATPSKIE